MGRGLCVAAMLAAAAGVASATVAVVLAGAAHRDAHIETTPAPVFSPAILALGFTPPAVGSYRLERILRAPDGVVLDSDGSVHHLREFTTGKVTLLSLIYTYCADARGCPLAYATLHALRSIARADPLLRGHVRFVSMSFDPAFDTPAMMHAYGGDDLAASSSVPWHFLTTSSPRELAPILVGFGQDVSVLDTGKPAARPPVLSHLLKVYLIDRAGMVREIYATAYLHPAVIRNDIATILLEPNAPGLVNPSGER